MDRYKSSDAAQGDVFTAPTQQRYAEYLEGCRAPDEADLDARQEELLRTIEFVAMMREAWSTDFAEEDQ